MAWVLWIILKMDVVDGLKSLYVLYVYSCFDKLDHLFLV